MKHLQILSNQMSDSSAFRHKYEAHYYELKLVMRNDNIHTKQQESRCSRTQWQNHVHVTSHQFVVVLPLYSGAANFSLFFYAIFVIFHDNFQFRILCFVFVSKIRRIGHLVDENLEVFYNRHLIIQLFLDRSRPGAEYEVLLSTHAKEHCSNLSVHCSPHRFPIFTCYTTFTHVLEHYIQNFSSWNGLAFVT